MSVRRADLELQRYVDGEMPSDEQVHFEARLSEDEELVAAVDELRDLRACFASERSADVAGAPASPGLTSRVLAEVRRSSLTPAGRVEEMHRVDHWSRRAVIAAVFVFGLAMLVFAGLLRKVDTGRLEASPAEIKRVMDRLDAAIQQAAIERREETRNR